MKKIEKFEGKEFHNPDWQYASNPTMHDIGKLQVKINELVEAHNQSVSQPSWKTSKEYKIGDKLLVNGEECVITRTVSQPEEDESFDIQTEDEFYQQKKEVENNTEEKARPEILMDIVHRIIRDNDLGLATEQIVDLLVANKKEKDSSLDNTEEWSNYIDNLFGTGHNGIWQVGAGEIMQLKKFIQQLLSERSFSKEELECIKRWKMACDDEFNLLLLLPSTGEDWGDLDFNDKTEEKVNRLLSSDGDQNEKHS